MHPSAGPGRLSVATLLAAWRAAVRDLGTITALDSRHPTGLVEVDRLRVAFHLAVGAAAATMPPVVTLERLDPLLFLSPNRPFRVDLASPAAQGDLVRPPR